MGTLLPLPKKGTEPPTQIFGPCLLCPNGLMHHDATWYGGRPQPRVLCVGWGPSPLPKKGAQLPPQFSAHVYCGQTAGWIKMALGVEVGLGPGHIVLDGEPAPLTQKGCRAPPIFGPFLLSPNGWMRQDATWYGGRPQPRRRCVRWGPSFTSPEGALPLIFVQCPLWPNDWMDEDATWYRNRHRPRPHCITWGPSSARKGHISPPYFWPMSMVAMVAHLSYC